VKNVLKGHEVIAFVATAQPGRALKFYGEVLGLNLVEDTPFALVFDVGGRMLRIQKVQMLVPAPHTVLGWGVPDIRSEIESLMSRGVAFEQYPGMLQDELGVWTSPDGHKVAWFRDADGNNLSLTEFRWR
jgi:catechol 2,3-dioxygenase-like lactoylglutathione lyase family enzyme